MLLLGYACGWYQQLLHIEDMRHHGGFLCFVLPGTTITVLTISCGLSVTLAATPSCGLSITLVATPSCGLSITLAATPKHKRQTSESGARCAHQNTN